MSFAPDCIDIRATTHRGTCGRYTIHITTAFYDSTHTRIQGTSSRRTNSRPTPSPEPAPRTKHSSPHKIRDKGKDKGDVRPTAEGRYKRKAEEAEEQIEALKAELEKTKRKQSAIMTEPSKLLPSASCPSAQPALLLLTVGRESQRARLQQLRDRRARRWPTRPRKRGYIRPLSSRTTSDQCCKFTVLVNLLLFFALHTYPSGLVLSSRFTRRCCFTWTHISDADRSSHTASSHHLYRYCT